MRIDENFFTREYSVYDDYGNCIASSEPKIVLKDVDSYLNYARRIDYLSVVYFNITKRCNYNCSYCYSVHENSTMSLEDAKLFLDKLDKLNMRSIAFIGGEPFCHPEFHELLKLCLARENMDDISIITNGSLINKEYIDLYKDPRVTMQVSIDGINESTNAPTRGKGHFEPVFENVKYLSENGARVLVKKVITRDNIEDSVEYYDFYKKNGIDAGFFMIKKVEDSAKPTTAQLRKLLDAVYVRESGDIYRTFEIVNFADNLLFENRGFPVMHCGAGINALSVLPNGDVFPCVKKEFEEFKITNLHDDNALAAIRANRQRILSEDLVINKSECEKCPDKFDCGGGCRAEEKEGNICKYNCDYFRFAKEYYFEKVLESVKLYGSVALNA